MILHIPHSSVKIPSNTNFLVPIDDDIDMLTDWHTDDLFEYKNSKQIVFGYSRLACDVERFVENEPMETKHGMGFVYEKNSYGVKIKEVTEEYKNWVKENLYDPHHKKLEDMVDIELAEYGESLIIDCHSFPDTPFPHETDKNRPDFCIGADDFHTPSSLITSVCEFINKNNYTVSINSPYSGSIVPIKHYCKTDNVKSIMIEINRKLYLNGTEKSESYNKSKYFINTLIDFILEFN